jgi:hypothetical protein
MALITASTVREHMDTDLEDTALERLIDDADADIVARFGAHTAAITERFTPGPSDVYLFTQRRISSITSITESYTGVVGETTDTLTTDDYQLEGGTQIRRREAGEFSRSSWAPRVTVVYVPVVDDARRTRVSLDLVRLALAYEALGSSSVGDVSVQHVNYTAERERILASLHPSFLGSFA